VQSVSSHAVILFHIHRVCAVNDRTDVRLDLLPTRDEKHKSVIGHYSIFDSWIDTRCQVFPVLTDPIRCAIPLSISH